MQRRRILVVDPDEDSRDIFRTMLEHHGYTVLMASAGEAAMELARREPPDLAIVDFPIRMPDGATLTETIRNDPDLGATPILAVTSKALANDSHEAREAGCNQVCMKPVDPRRVAVQVRQMIGSAQVEAPEEGPPQELDAE